MFRVALRSNYRWNIKLNLFVGNGSVNICGLLSFGFGGGNIGSRAIFKAFSSIAGMMRPRRELDYSRHGLVLTSINHGLKELSIRKSKPKTSKVC
jgi:hypothetical protein